MTAGPAVIAIGKVSVNAVRWRFRGVDRMTVIVRATFSWVADGRMQPRRARAAEHADDVPWKRQAEVWVEGGALAAFPRLSVRHERGYLIDKRGPDVGARSAPVAWTPAIDEHVAWDKFQRAPVDQRCDGFGGDEWIELFDLHPAGTWRSQLPRAVARARVYGAHAGPPESVAMVLDTVVVDVGAECCELTWRGNFVMSDAEQPVTVAGAVEHDDHAVIWPAPDLDLEGTMVMTEPSDHPLEQTVALLGEHDFAETRAPYQVAKAGSGLPIDPPPGSPWARSKVDSEPVRSPDVSQESTMRLSAMGEADADDAPPRQEDADARKAEELAARQARAEAEAAEARREAAAAQFRAEAGGRRTRRKGA